MSLTAHSLALLPPDHEGGDAKPSGEEEDPSNPELGLVVGDLRENTMRTDKGGETVVQDAGMLVSKGFPFLLNIPPTVLLQAQDGLGMGM